MVTVKLFSLLKFSFQRFGPFLVTFRSPSRLSVTLFRFGAGCKVEMKAVVTRQHTASFLPHIPTNSNKWKGGTPYRVRQEKKSDKSTQILSREQIAQFRNSLKQNISVQLLQEGYHRSFSEFFSLLQSEQSRIEAADPSSDLRLQTPLEDQPDKLEAMRLHLSHAEQAERIGSWSKVCEQRLLVAQFFSAPEDLWLRLHFYHSCADREQGGRSRPATEARACMADIYLQQGDLLEATHQAELCYQQAEDGGWLDSTGRPLRLRAQQTLWEIYTRRADALLDAAKYKEALKLLHRGHSIITESEDKQGEGEATYRLGMAYQRSGDHDTAKKFLNTSMQIYDRLQDAEGLVKAYKVWVTSVESEGNTHETVRCLKKLVDIAQSNGLKQNLTDAFLHLGHVYNKVNQYSRACDFFLQGYEVACNIGDVSLVEKAQVLASNARGHTLIRRYSAIMELTASTTPQHLLAWKESRGRQELSPDSTNPAASPGPESSSSLIIS